MRGGLLGAAILGAPVAPARIVAGHHDDQIPQVAASPSRPVQLRRQK